jgi:uncharacterized membrane protein
MKQWLVLVSEYSIVLIDAMALVIVLYASVEAFIRGGRIAFGPNTAEERRHDVWMRFMRWLVAGLTFQLAADIIETSISTSWEAIVRIAAIAAVRTFLNFFLERDLSNLRDRERPSAPK